MGYYDWDIELDGVSIKDQISDFSIKEAKGSYVRELTLTANVPSFYDLFDYTELPVLRIEVFTKAGGSFISQGNFYIERPGISVLSDSITSSSVWGRSETAVLGSPFAAKISKTWTIDTTCYAIIDEMVALCGITVTKEMADYPIVAETFTVANLYPIEVIQKLVNYSNGYLCCNPAGELLVKEELYHPSTSAYSLTDADIIQIVENVVYPEFGNRILVGAMGEGGYSVELFAINSNCLPDDGTAKATLLAFVTDSEGEVAVDGTVVNWSIEGGSGATLDHAISNIGTFFIEDYLVKSSSYHVIEVEYPIYDVIGIWAYSDYSKRTNYWNSATDSFSDNAISLIATLPYCDQTLVISYLTYGCATNIVTAGSTDIDVEVIADVEGSQDSLIIKQGAGCDCGGGSLGDYGTGINIAINPNSGVCFGNSANILIWGTVNGATAIGRTATLSIFSGCGTLSSTSKILGTEAITNEKGTAFNNISGVTQCTTNIIIDDKTTPTVYEFTEDDEGVITKTGSNLYLSHDSPSKTIDLDTILVTGTEVSIDYTASGAALASWKTDGITVGCDVVIAVEMADGSEAGLRATASTGVIDCDVPDEDGIPFIPIGDSSDDPDDWNSEDNSGGTVDPDDEDDGGISLTVCDVAVLNRIASKDAAVTDEEIEVNRFQTDECPEDEADQCSCAELCESEFYETGSSYDYPGQTIVQMVEEDGYVEGTPEYNEALATAKDEVIAECETNCETAREEACGGCTPTTEPVDLVLAPGDSLEITCSDGTTGLIEMPEGACGTVEFTVGCCTFEVRSTDGYWVKVDDRYIEYPATACNVSPQQCLADEIVSGGIREQANYRCIDPICMELLGAVLPNCSVSCIIPTLENCGSYETPAVPIFCATYEWQCLP